MSEQQFESLGRYTAYKEEAEKLARERNRALADLKRLIQSAVGEGPTISAYDFNTAKAEELLAKAGRLHREMQQAKAEANDAAAGCGKPALTTISY